jgi:hypothetical protein
LKKLENLAVNKAQKVFKNKVWQALEANMKFEIERRKIEKESENRKV